MTTQRRLTLALGGALGLLLVVGMAFAMPAKHKQHHRPACLPYLLIPTVHICGTKVYLVAAGRKQYIGLTKDLQPMPAPLPFHRHMRAGK